MKALKYSIISICVLTFLIFAAILSRAWYLRHLPDEDVYETGDVQIEESTKGKKGRRANDILVYPLPVKPASAQQDTSPPKKEKKEKSVSRVTQSLKALDYFN